MQSRQPALADHILWLLTLALVLCAASSALAIIAASTATLVQIEVPSIDIIANSNGNSTHETSLLPQISVSVGLFQFCSGGACYERRDELTVPAVTQFLAGNFSSVGSEEMLSRAQVIAGSSLQFGFSQASACGETSNSFAAVDGVIVAAWALCAATNLLAALSTGWLLVGLRRPLPTRDEKQLRLHRSKEDNLRFLAAALAGAGGSGAAVGFALTLWSLLQRWGCGSSYCSFVIDPVNALLSELSSTDEATCAYGASFFCSCIAFGLSFIAALLLLFVTLPVLRDRAHATKRFLRMLIMRSAEPPAAAPIAVVAGGIASRTVPEGNTSVQNVESDNDFSDRSATPPDSRPQQMTKHMKGEQRMEDEELRSLDQQAEVKREEHVFSSNLIAFTQRATTMTSTTVSINSFHHLSGNFQELAESGDTAAAGVIVSDESDERRLIEQSVACASRSIVLEWQKCGRAENLVVFHQCTLDWLFGPVLDIHLMETFMRQKLIEKWHGKLKKSLTDLSMKPPLPLPYFLRVASHYAFADDSACPRVPTERWLSAVDTEYCHRDDVNVSPLSVADPLAEDVEVSSESDAEDAAGMRSRGEFRAGTDEWSLQQRYAALVQKAVASSAAARHRASTAIETPARPSGSSSASSFDHQFSYELSLLKASAGRSVDVHHTAWGRRTFDPAGASSSNGAVFTVDSSWGAASVDNRLAKLKQHSTRRTRGKNESMADSPSAGSNTSSTNANSEQ